MFEKYVITIAPSFITERSSYSRIKSATATGGKKCPLAVAFANYVSTTNSKTPTARFVSCTLAERQHKTPDPSSARD